MKNLQKFAILAIFVFAAAVTGWAQRGGSAPSSSSSTVGSTSSTSAPSSSSSSTGTYSSSSRDFSPASTSSGSGSYYGGSSIYYPNLSGTSWSSYNTWMQWQRYYNYLQSMYFMNPGYLSRFTRNVEPLATPELVKLTFRRPLKLSLQMLDAVQELEDMLQSAQSGKQVDKQAVMAKIQEIRELDRQILKDQGLDLFDQRRDKDVPKAAQFEKLGLDAVSKLREMVTDLSTQLKNMYTETKPSVISVSSLSQPSYKSMCKEIDKLSKVIENSARRL